VQRRIISGDAAALITALRAPYSHPSVFEQLLAHFSLATEEGLALMGLAESLLRIPDDPTALNVLRRQLAQGQWSGAAALARSLWPRLAARALNLTAWLTGPRPDHDTAIFRRLSAPVILQLARHAMSHLGDQFILGSSLPEGLRHAHGCPSGSLFSFDLLGEGARTFRQADAYQAAFLDAIETLKNQKLPRLHAAAPAPLQRASLSVKLSALEPRYEEAQRQNVLRRLVPKLSAIFEAAAAANLAVTVDAEESDRLEISLDVIAAALKSPRLATWAGAGLAVQAYGTRALNIIEWAADLARTRGTPLHVRLVKGAYWDTEIKRAQERGLPEYPVYTRKAATDVAYLAAANRLFRHSGVLWPQFATHNPHTLCAVRELAGERPYELQRLHGMGERLYRAAANRFHDLPPVRIYAPIGDHCSLLPYLVRRLLENGANTSFLSQQDDPNVAPATLAADPLLFLDCSESHLPLPTAMFAPERKTARAWDLGRSQVWQELRTWYARTAFEPYRPAWSTSAAEARAALDAAHHAQRHWAKTSADERARCLERAAQALEDDAPRLLPLLVREAGKCWPEAIAELREAVDFCRYYAARARDLGEGRHFPGPTGESNILTWHPRGVFYSIAPWNFPLAIFLGQIAAAVVVGNAVLAKPAPQTPMIGAAAIKVLIEAGIPADVLQFLPGDGIAVSEAVLGDSRIGGVAFTGSTATAKLLHRQLAAREGPIIPFIAETGGINAMIVDSTALLEQVVDDVITSAFRGAGQRCSALRLLCVQEDIAAPLLEMLMGAMDTLVVGDALDPATDVGPLIDRPAWQRIQDYLTALPAGARLLHRMNIGARASFGRWIAPTLIEISNVSDLSREIFGPVLHVVRYRATELESLVAAIEASGYGLTLGIHTRLPERAQRIFADSRIGNTYVNRHMVGATVGVQPFGGEGLSGTGPKAGGPHYLERFAVERVFTVNETAWGGNVALLRGPTTPPSVKRS
jgi:RHH-type proline utilization regulon transcriptional repressor/proline dehydrogenase/delta 1-pyrroline-5-carboxylate dehydrogenase